MTLPTKSTKQNEALRGELVELEDRINEKIRRITWTHQKLQYDRLAKGRLLKETVLLAIDHLDKGENAKLTLVLDRILDWAGLVSLPIPDQPVWREWV